MSAHPSAADTPARIVDESDLRKYRTELPNLIDDLSLSPYAQRLYSHIKRRAGGNNGGECKAGLRGMARHCDMSLGKASAARKELLDRGLIRIERKSAKEGGFYDSITIVDIWLANFAFYEALKSGTLTAKGDDIRPAADAFLKSSLSDGVHIVNTAHGVHVVSRSVQTVNAGCSCGERKKEPQGERTKEEPTPRARQRADPSPVRAGGGESAALSRFDYETQVLPWAKAQKAADPNVKSAEALARARWRDGTDDSRIAAWLEAQQPEAVTRSLQPPPRAQMGLRQVLQYIGSILDVNPRLDIAGALDQLDVSEETRAHVLSYDFPQRQAAAPTQTGAARAREPEPARVRRLRPVTSGVSMTR